MFDTLADFSEDPVVRAGVQQLTRLASSLRPTLHFLTPAQTTCNYATLWFRNAASLLSDGDSNGTWQRFQVVSAPTDIPNLSRIPLSDVYGPNNEGEPSSAPANGPERGQPPPLQPVPEHGGARPDARVRGGQRALPGHGRQDDDRQPAR